MKKPRTSSPFRFVSSGKAGQYSVWRGEATWLGHVERVTYRVHGEKVSPGWKPTTRAGRVLELATNRQTAARALWEAQRGSAESGEPR